MKKKYLGMSGSFLVLSLSALALPTKEESTEVPDQIDDPGPSYCSTVAGNIVMNCGFETGVFSPWVQSGDTSFTGVTPRSAHTGNLGAEFGPVGSLGYITQNLSTTAGQQYALTFWLRNAGQPNRFQVFWNGAIIYDVTDVPDFTFMPVNFGGLMATSASTELKFGFFNPPDWFFIDDVVAVSCSGGD